MAGFFSLEINVWGRFDFILFQPDSPSYPYPQPFQCVYIAPFLWIFPLDVFTKAPCFVCRYFKFT